ncbi:MAG: hypothetical protein H7Y07_12985 [Pyrinomonadaceae bacterium]|nr:hypothetical protein [Sphingobacteriaceae bacterium]
MEICLLLSGDKCTGLSVSDFDTYKIPAPPQGSKEEGLNCYLIFSNSEEAIKYAIHLNDVYERMEASSKYKCSRKKIKQIIKAVNEQADFKDLTF